MGGGGGGGGATDTEKRRRKKASSSTPIQNLPFSFTGITINSLLVLL